MGRKQRDLTGMRFGRLTALRRLEEKSGSCYLWLCRCDCGKEIKVPSNALKSGNTQSCGCAQHRSKPLPLNYIDGTCVEILERSGLRKDNTSGVTGVVRTRRGWRAQITFKKKNYYLGTYKSLERAAYVRKQAELNLHGAFLDWYHDEFTAKKIPARVSDVTAERVASV